LKMSRFKSILTLLFLFLAGCNSRESGEYSKVHWDRDMCERCKMVLSDRKFATQIVNPQDNRVYYFDDIGCAVLWLDEEHIKWKDKAKIWVVDIKSGEWIDAKKALFSDDLITPMAYGLGAYKKDSFPKDKKALNFEEMVKKVKEIEQIYNKKGVKVDR